MSAFKIILNKMNQQFDDIKNKLKFRNLIYTIFKKSLIHNFFQTSNFLLN